MVFWLPFRGPCPEGAEGLFLNGNTRQMWYLLEDFLEQPLAMKLFLGVGWLCVVIMGASLAASLVGGG